MSRLDSDLGIEVSGTVAFCKWQPVCEHVNDMVMHLLLLEYTAIVNGRLLFDTILVVLVFIFNCPF